MQYTNMSKAFYLTTDEYLSLIKQGLNQYFPDDSQPNHPEDLHTNIESIMNTINVLSDFYIQRYYGSLNNNVEVDSNDSEDYDEEDDEDIN